MIRVLLAEDPTIVRRGIATLLTLTQDIRVTGEAADGEEAYLLSCRQTFDVALLDIRMPLLAGYDLLRRWTKEAKKLPAILLTTFDEDSLFLEALRARAQGFLLKDASVERLAETIRAVAGGGTLLQPVLTERVIRIVREMGTAFDSAERPEALSPREREVLRLMAGGYSNREIARALRMSEGSAKNHASSLLAKLGARDRTRAVLRAIELGLL